MSDQSTAAPSRGAALLANHIKRAVRGPMWHGQALGELLAGVSPEQAAARPIAGAHTIWEIVLHVTAWADITRERLRGQRTADPTPEEDWPSPGDTSDLGHAAWETTIERLRESHRALAAVVKQLDDEAIAAKVPGLDYSVSNILHGVIEHGTYHGGQIALLKRAATGRRT
jgi:uncharacterized damage-inducible protein DinB